MAELSISRAWDATKATLARDGRLITTVALAMVALPTAIGEFVNPGSGMIRESQSLGDAFLAVLISVIGLIGQLAIIRLVVGPSVSVSEAIAHGTRRALPYIGAAILIILGFILIAIPFAVVLAAMGMDFEPPIGTIPGSAWIVLILFMLVALYIAVRLMLSSPVASTERVGPVGIIGRSWKLTRGHAPRLLGFIILFVLAAGITLGAIALAVGAMTGLIFGPVEPMNASALITGLVSGIAGALATVLFVVMVAHFYLQLSGAEAHASVPSSG